MTQTAYSSKDQTFYELIRAVQPKVRTMENKVKKRALVFSMQFYFFKQFSHETFQRQKFF